MPSSASACDLQPLCEPTGPTQEHGTRLHPNLDTYRDGGMGGLPDSHSVVGFVDPRRLLAYREHHGSAHYDSPKILAELSESLTSTGLTTPLMVMYDPTERWAFLGEGNHRLAAALATFTDLVPVRVNRCSGMATRKAAGIGGPAIHLDQGWGTRYDPDYCPSDLHPGYLAALA